MSHNLRILLRAQRDIKESSEWYEERSQGLGQRFARDVFAKITSVKNNPLHYPLKGNLREAILNDFPYLIIYRIDQSETTVVIMSVFHMNQHPKKK